MLQTMKELVIKMVPQITNQQWSFLLSPSPHDTLNTQPPNYPHHGSLRTHPYPPQLPLNKMPQPTLHPTTPPIYMQPQSTQGNTSPPYQQLKRFHHHFHKFKYQTILLFHNRKHPSRMQWPRSTLTFESDIPYSPAKSSDHDSYKYKKFFQCLFSKTAAKNTYHNQYIIKLLYYKNN